MTNEVAMYERTQANIGSFGDDRLEFSMTGGRTNVAANTGIVSLALGIVKDYSRHSTTALSRQMSKEELLGRVILGGAGYPVYVRTTNDSSVAFYTYMQGGCYRTIILAGETHPPLHGSQTWWRDIVRPRLRDIIGV